MERHFEKDLNEMKERLLWMGSLAERAVHQSVHAVLESDEQLAKRVLDEEDAINELQMEIDDRVVQLLALELVDGVFFIEDALGELFVGFQNGVNGLVNGALRQAAHPEQALFHLVQVFFEVAFHEPLSLV